MKVIRYIIINFLFLTFLTCCENTQIKSNKNTINIDLKRIKIDFQDSTLVKDISYVFLETNKECLIGNFDKMLMVNNNIYILDKTLTHTIFVFDRNGNFLYKINKQGKGPGEYIQIFDFYVDNDENIYAWDVEKKTIIKYSEKGEKFKEFKINHRFLEFSLFAKNEILVRNLIEEGKITASLAKINILTNEMTVILKARELYDDIGIPRNSSHYFFNSGNDILFSPMFSNDIYEINNGTISKKLLFTDNIIPNKHFIKQLKADQMLQYKVNYFLSDVISIYQNSEVYVMTLIKGMPQLLVINKKTGKCKSIIDYSNINYFGRMGIYGEYNDYFISRVDISSIQNEEWHRKINRSHLSKGTKEKLLEIDTNSNPVLVFFKLD